LAYLAFAEGALPRRTEAISYERVPNIAQNSMPNNSQSDTESISLALGIMIHNLRSGRTPTCDDPIGKGATTARWRTTIRNHPWNRKFSGVTVVLSIDRAPATRWSNGKRTVFQPIRRNIVIFRSLRESR